MGEVVSIMLRPAGRIAVSPASSAVSMRKRDVRWLQMAAGPNGCNVDKCATAFLRLGCLGFVEVYNLSSGPDRNLTYAKITPAGADALANWPATSR